MNNLSTREEVKKKIEEILNRDYLRAELGFLFTFKKACKDDYKHSFILQFNDYTINLIQRTYDTVHHSKNPTELCRKMWLIEKYKELNQEFLQAKKRDIGNLKEIKELSCRIKIELESIDATSKLIKSIKVLKNMRTRSLIVIREIADLNNLMEQYKQRNKLIQNMLIRKSELKMQTRDKEHIVADFVRIIREYEYLILDKRFKAKKAYTTQSYSEIITEDTGNKQIQHSIIRSILRSSDGAEEERLLLNAIEYRNVYRRVKNVLNVAKRHHYNDFKLKSAVIKAISRYLYLKPLRYEEAKAIAFMITEKISKETLKSKDKKRKNNNRPLNIGMKVITKTFKEEHRTDPAVIYSRIRGRHGSTKGYNNTFRFGMNYSSDIVLNRFRSRNVPMVVE